MTEKKIDNAENSSTMKTKQHTPGKRKRQPQKKEPLPGVAQENQSPLKPITADEQAIAARVAADQDKEWETVGENSALDYSLGRDLFELPPPAKKEQEEKRYAFRWTERTQRRIDEIRSKPIPIKWWICNSTNTPFLKGHFDPVLGCVTREDQILMFKPWWMHEKQRAIVAEITDGKNQDLTRLNREKRGSAEFVAGKRQDGDPSLRQEIKGGDKIVYDGETEEGAGMMGDLGDLIAE